ncbi:hypothetical protein Barb4_02452 [Bacteroidales bacterium Barb4]|nr:hypothetical protein Barb4_02452 [Bacteroidales bacterium Barb4]
MSGLEREISTGQDLKDDIPVCYPRLLCCSRAFFSSNATANLWVTFLILTRGQIYEDFPCGAAFNPTFRYAACGVNGTIANKF